MPYKQKEVSTNAILGGAGTYTSANISTASFTTLCGVVSSDQAGTLNIQALNEATGAYVTVLAISVLANAAQTYSQKISSTSYRLNYVNGATPQTVFGLTGYLEI